MKLPWRRKALSVSPEVLEAVATRQLNLYRRLGGTNERVRAAFTRAQGWGYWHAYINSPSVRSVIDLVAYNVGQLDLRLYEEVNESERRARYDHPAAESMRYPNSSAPADQFIRDLITQYLVFGNAYASKHRTTNGGPLMFQVLPADRVEVVGQRLFEADGYIYHRPDGSTFDLPTSAVIHWHNSNSSDPRMGVSILETLRHVIAEEAALQQAIVELAQSGLTQPGWVSRPLEAPNWSNDARERFEEDLVNRLRRTGSPPVLEEGMEFKGIGTSPREAQMLEVRKYTLQQVATAYHVPLGMLGLVESSTAIADAQAQFYADTLPPLCEQLTRVFNLFICQQEYGDDSLCFQFNLDEKQMGNERLKALTSASGVPVMTRNEARARINLPPVKDGDEPITPSNVIVGGKPSINVMPIQDPNKPSQEGDARGDGDTPVPSSNGSGGS